MSIRVRLCGGPWHRHSGELPDEEPPPTVPYNPNYEVMMHVVSLYPAGDYRLGERNGRGEWVYHWAGSRPFTVSDPCLDGTAHH
jgi:hypothetical protein